MESQYRKALKSLPLGGIQYHSSVGSTNDEALVLAAQNAPDLTLIIANEQTQGRGRMGRQWFTPPNSALAMSLILRPTHSEKSLPSRATGLLAVALTEALQELGLSPRIKWPNDVLIDGQKVAGILVESVWLGDELDALILGLGVNVLHASVPPAKQLGFPTTSIEDETGMYINRAKLLTSILSRVLKWRPKLGTEVFLKAWEENLAFFGQQVQVKTGEGEKTTGEVVGLAMDGGLLLRNEYGKSVTVHFGEVHLRPLP